MKRSRRNGFNLLCSELKRKAPGLYRALFCGGIIKFTRKASAPVRRFGADVGGAPGIAVAITSKIC